MNKEKKNRMKCADCIFYGENAHGKPYCEQEPKYVIDKHTRRPDWCPLSKKKKEVTDEQLKIVDALNEVPLENIVTAEDLRRMGFTDEAT